MMTKYDIGDVVMIPATVNKVMINHNGDIYYDMVKIVDNGSTGLYNVPEENIIDTLAAYDKKEERELTRELINKKVDLIKQLREANGFSANEIALIMNMDECNVIRILQTKEDE